MTARCVAGSLVLNISRHDAPGTGTSTSQLVINWSRRAHTNTSACNVMVGNQGLGACFDIHTNYASLHQ
ncbi:hypothetical protein E2C01_087919 [Portunus trituberculatus]|uniref:Uncharacterized protein n=1 Tax=Portunus trituberculatus TaxID=210409 RepID=A0A5B7J4S9_PORTR|nr:hypothetical protein [Portunus trituberculatus]